MSDEHKDNLFVEEKRDVKSRMAALGNSERPLLLEAMGGPLGIAESAIPSLAFVVAITAKASVEQGAIIAVAFAVALGVARLLRRQTIQFAVAGIFGVVISAFIATKTGNAKDYFVPSFFVNAGYAALAFASAAFRHPFVGYVVDGLSGGENNWRQDPVKMRKYRLAAMIWGSLFLLRLAVQLPLYFADALVALGTAKIVMGYPLFGIGIWTTWLLVRKTPEEKAAAEAAKAEAEAAEADAPAAAAAVSPTDRD